MKHFFYSMIVPVLVLLISIRPCIGSNRIQIPIDKELSSTCVSITTLESNSNYYKINVKINQLNDETIIKNNQVFHQLSLDDNKTLRDVGKPALPVISQFIGLPVGCTFSSMITDEKWTDVCIGKIYPAQKPRTDISEDSTFAYSEEDYNVTCFKHQLLSESEVMTWKGIENVYLTLCPFKYYPLENRMSVLSEFTLIVRFSAKKQKTPHKITIKERDLSVFDNKNFLSMEYLESASSMTRTSNDDYDYLIIVGNIPAIENSQEMKDFRRWKALKGFKTKVVSTSTIGSDSASIKSFIDNEYDTYSIERVLFVGDHTKIPLPVFTARLNLSDHPIVKSDYWYGCRGGYNDVEAEIPIGRFITNTLTDFRNIVNKTIKYESLNHTWSNRVLLVANLQSAPYFYQGGMEDIRNATYSHPMDFYKAYVAAPSVGGNNARATDIFNYINNGINIVAYNGHGDYNRWRLNCNGWPIGVDSLVCQSDTAMMNSDTYPVIVSMACSNGDFSRSESIIWQWTRNDHCTTAYIGGTVPVFSNESIDYLIYFYNVLLNNNSNLLGNTNIAANVLAISLGDGAIDNAFSLVCGGDPSLELWTGVQSEFDNTNLSISGNNLVISTQSINNYYVNIASTDGMLLGNYYSNGTNITIPLPDIDCDIALNKHNYVPYVIHFRKQCIQNEILSGQGVFVGTPMQIGYDVINTKPYGNVVIEPNAKVIIYNGNGGVYIKNGFECKQGAELEIK